MRLRTCLIFVVFVANLSAQNSPPAPPDEIHDFDFWIGSWEVTTPDGKVAGHNVIAPILSHRVIRESYTTPGAYAGHSFNLYNAAEQRWEQFWVDVGGLALHIVGGLNEAGEMVLSGQRTGGDGVPVWDRITWTPNADATVRQHWEQSPDGEHWTTAFDGLYRPVTAD